MATKEFYIRNASETEARGPFNLEQLVSLSETGQVTVDTLYYEAMDEKWVAIGDNPDLRAALFPEKKRLTLKKDAAVPSLNKSHEDHPGIDVHDMLAAAEARTDDTREKGSHLVMVDRCAKIGLWGAIAILLIAMAGEIIPAIDVLTAFTPAKLLEHPLVALGLIDLFLAILLILGVVSAYPFVRFRAMLGLGFMAFLFYTHGQTLPLIAAIAGSAGLYICTVFLSYGPVALGLVLGLGGMGVLTWLLIR